MSEKEIVPYFGGGDRTAPAPENLENVAFVDFLARLDGPAKVEIDRKQEMLLMVLRNRCLPYALSPQSEQSLVNLLP